MKTPKSVKTKCMAFLTKERDLGELNLDGKKLPWADSVKHLGNKIQQMQKNETRCNGEACGIH